MAWLESHQTLADHPKVKKLARLLHTSIPAAIGHLHLLWWWAMDYAQDGDLSLFSPEDIADAARWTKKPQAFVDALLQCGLTQDRPGFLEASASGGMVIHDWWDYAGRLLEKRRDDADRKRRNRGASAARPPDNLRDGARTVPNTTQPTQPDTTVPDTTNAAATDTNPDVGFRDRYGTLTTALGGHLEQRTCDEFAQIAEDYDLDAITAAIRQCRTDNKRPYPSEVRKRLKGSSDGRTQAPIRSVEEQRILDQYRASGVLVE